MKETTDVRLTGIRKMNQKAKTPGVLPHRSNEARTKTKTNQLERANLMSKWKKDRMDKVDAMRVRIHCSPTLETLGRFSSLFPTRDGLHVSTSGAENRRHERAALRQDGVNGILIDRFDLVCCPSGSLPSVG